ncbi:hypothetical protein HPB50_023704 [Hyalomma asiaticum]|uniref:Uncharacterized protein n=1 Tax=Hyalomma asiaticum TaxID=266040 RepID=A0ACB7T4V2_HYAAI|nr:hypothetical protein HPB50_023704 [Hyalomma asiaticum]
MMYPRLLLVGATIVVTTVSFFYYLNKSSRVYKAISSSDVAFLPTAMNTICLFSWLIYGIAIENLTVMWVSVCGIALVAANAAVHRDFSRHTEASFVLAAWLGLMCTASSWMSATWLRLMALGWTVSANLAPIVRVLWTTPLPEIALTTTTTNGVWLAYATLVGNAALAVCSLPGVVVGAVELYACLRAQTCPGAHVPAQVA